MNDQLIPKQPRRLRQPSKQVLRDQLALAATEIERLRGENERLRTPGWVRAWNRWLAGAPLPIGSNPPPPPGPKPPPPPCPPPATTLVRDGKPTKFT